MISTHVLMHLPVFDRWFTVMDRWSNRWVHIRSILYDMHGLSGWSYRS